MRNCQCLIEGGETTPKTSIRIVLVHIKCYIKLARVKFVPFSVFFTLITMCSYESNWHIYCTFSWENEFRYPKKKKIPFLFHYWVSIWHQIWVCVKGGLLMVMHFMVYFTSSTSIDTKPFFNLISDISYSDAAQRPVIFTISSFVPHTFTFGRLKTWLLSAWLQPTFCTGG